MAYIFDITLVLLSHISSYFSLSVFLQVLKQAKLTDKCERRFENIMQKRTSVFNFKKMYQQVFLDKISGIPKKRTVDPIEEPITEDHKKDPITEEHKENPITGTLKKTLLLRTLKSILKRTLSLRKPNMAISLRILKKTLLRTLKRTLLLRNL